jgi:hypothetical protein
MSSRDGRAGQDSGLIGNIFRRNPSVPATGSRNRFLPRKLNFRKLVFTTCSLPLVVDGEAKWSDIKPGCVGREVVLQPRTWTLARKLTRLREPYGQRQCTAPKIIISISLSGIHGIRAASAIFSIKLNIASPSRLCHRGSISSSRSKGSLTPFLTHQPTWLHLLSSHHPYHQRDGHLRLHPASL